MDNPIKVLHVIGGGEFGGAEQHILALMEEFKDSPVEAEVITFYEAPFARKLRAMGHRVTVIQPFGRFDFRLYSGLVSLFQKTKPDIVHTHGVRANFFGRLASRKAGIPHVVTTLHSILRHDYPKKADFWIANAMERWTLRLSDHFVVVSEAIRQYAIRAGIDESKISVVYNGIDSEKYRMNPERITMGRQLRKEWNIPDPSFVIGTTARLVPVKGLSCLIQGFAAALREEPDLYLLIIGEGPEKESLEKLAQTLGITDRIRFAGFRTDIPECLAAMDLYINTSLSEGLPISLMEAMAAERPVVVTKVGGMKEMVTHEESGLFIPPQSPEAVAQAVLRLKRNHALRESLGKRARAVVEERYSIKGMAEKQIKIYQHLVKGTPHDVS